MPTLLAPLPPPSTRMELPTVSFFGRTFEEYTRFFALDPAALRRLSVLDVAAGPSSFTAEAARREIDAVAVDPLYGARPPRNWPPACGRINRRMFAQMRAKRHLFRLKVVQVLRRRRGRPAAGRGAFPGRLRRQRAARPLRAGVAARGSRFLDQGFSLVLCAHLLFTYADRFDYAWHPRGLPRAGARVGRRGADPSGVQRRRPDLRRAPAPARRPRRAGHPQRHRARGLRILRRGPTACWCCAATRSLRRVPAA